MNLPILQRKIARYLALELDAGVSPDEVAEELVDIVIDYLHEQSYKKTELDLKTFSCENSIGGHHE